MAKKQWTQEEIEKQVQPKPTARNFNDLTGRRFGTLTVTCFGWRHPTQEDHYWQCRCDCGRVHVVLGKSLKLGKTRSCGCATGKHITAAKTRHGQGSQGEKRSVEYTAWASMKARCGDSSNKEYFRYGARGIMVCQEWEHSFEAFFAEVGKKPSRLHSLDRYPNQNGNYEPGNVRWATAKEQARNRRSNRLIEIDGETRTLAEWSEISCTNHATIIRRLKNGWEPKRAVFAVPFTCSWSSTGVRGVLPNRHGRFIASIHVGGKLRHLGTFDTVEQASVAYKAAAEERSRRKTDGKSTPTSVP